MADGVKRYSLVFNDVTTASANKLLAKPNTVHRDYAVSGVGNVDVGFPRYVQRDSFGATPSPYDDEQPARLAAAFFGGRSIFGWSDIYISWISLLADRNIRHKAYGSCSAFRQISGDIPAKNTPYERSRNWRRYQLSISRFAITHAEQHSV